jgi:hypothetical protein
MGEYEPHDSRNVTLKPERASGEPPRSGPREGETRKGETGDDGKRRDAETRERAIEQDAEKLDAALREERKR